MARRPVTDRGYRQDRHHDAHQTGESEEQAYVCSGTRVRPGAVDHEAVGELIGGHPAGQRGRDRDDVQTVEAHAQRQQCRAPGDGQAEDGNHGYLVVA